MSSTDELASWLERHSETVRRISRDPLDAERKLALAERNLERAQRLLAAGDPDFALVAAESAMVNAADAVLSTHGFRLRGKTGSHEARFGFPALPPAFREQAHLISAARKSRNVAMYDDPGRVSDSFATAVIQTARQLTEAVRRTLR
jgi:HEPN domain-containing protein